VQVPPRFLVAKSNPKKPLNRHDAKVAKGAMFRTLDRRTRKPVYGAFRSSVPPPPLSHFGLGVLGALAVENFGLGLIYPAGPKGVKNSSPRRHGITPLSDASMPLLGG
jgi:hypothetical protein